MPNLRDASTRAQSVIDALGLQPHPEGGYFRETWRDQPDDGGRGVGTAILFLLAEGQSSHWHRVDAAELWLWQAGAALTLAISPDGHGLSEQVLGPDLALQQVLQGVVPKGHWQAAASLGGWSLVSCIVTPAFHFDGFEMAPPGWQPTMQAVR